jgi:predicted metal-dependent peptidase
MVSTKMRASKRFQQFPGIRIRRERRIAVVIDTSGSIDEASLGLFFGEIHGIWKTGAELLILECDAQVQRSYPYQGRTPTLVQGGGGTDFDPAFEWIKRPEHGKFDACIYLTDGYGPKPKTRISCPVLWVLVSDLTAVDHLPGRVISLDS